MVNVDGVNILTTPTETSIWKGRLEKDKVSPHTFLSLATSYPMYASKSILKADTTTIPGHSVLRSSDSAPAHGGERVRRYRHLWGRNYNSGHNAVFSSEGQKRVR